MKFFVIQPLSNRQKSNSFFLAVLFFVLLIFTFFIDPREVTVISCQFKNVTGYNCPTCGLSRSFYAFAGLNLYEAFTYHFMGPFLYLASTILFFKSTAEIIFEKKIKFNISGQILKLGIFLLVIIWLAVWIYNLNQG